jgi:hypothetical protein
MARPSAPARQSLQLRQLQVGIRSVTSLLLTPVRRKLKKPNQKCFGFFMEDENLKVEIDFGLIGKSLFYSIVTKNWRHSNRYSVE